MDFDSEGAQIKKIDLKMTSRKILAIKKASDSK